MRITDGTAAAEADDAEGGEEYVLSYMCTSLKVPKLAAMKALKARIAATRLKTYNQHNTGT